MSTNITSIKDIDIKDVSLFQFIDVINSQWILKKYFESTPDVEIEYFSEKEEKEILATSQYKNFKNAINKEFLWK